MFYFWPACVLILVCDVCKPITLLLSAIQRTAKVILLMESVSVSGISPSCKLKNLNSFCRIKRNTSTKKPILPSHSYVNIYITYSPLSGPHMYKKFESLMAQLTQHRFL